MAKSKKLMKSKQRLSRDEFADMLEMLAERVRDGRVRLKQGSDKVVLELPKNFTVELEVEEKPTRRGTKCELEIEVEWTVGADGPIDRARGLTIR